MRERIRSVAEIENIERAYRQGVPALGHPASEWLRRWRLPLRDHETFLRLAFLCWYREHEPTWLTGLDAELPGVDALIAKAGGEAALPGEALFALAILWNLFAPLEADEAEYQERARTFAQRASTLEPQSHLFREWHHILGEAAETIKPRIYGGACAVSWPWGDGRLPGPHPGGSAFSECATTPAGIILQHAAAACAAAFAPELSR